MPQLVVAQDSFSQGELGPYMSERADSPLFHSAAQTLENFMVLPHGGVMRRHGFEFIYNSGTYNANQTALYIFDFARDQQYVLFFTHLTLYIFRDKVLVSTVATTFTGTELQDLRFTQSGDTMIIVHPNHPPRSLVRNNSDISWTLADITFKNRPFHRYSFATSVSSSATSGTVQLTCTSAGVFTSAYIGTHLFVNGAEVSITGFLDSANITGSITGTMTTTAADPTWKEWAWSGAHGYPRTATFHQNRLVFGGTLDATETIFASVTGDFYNFDDNTVSKATITDSSAYAFTLSTDEIHIIRDLKSQIDLNIFTSQGEHQLNAGSAGGAVTATNVNVSLQSRYGCSGIRVIEVDGELLFNSSNYKEIRSYVYQFSTNKYASDNKTQLAHHLFENDTLPMDMAYMRSYMDTQANSIFVPRQDGSMAVCTINVAREVLAWSRFTTNGQFVRVTTCVTDHGDGNPIETLYAVVSRSNGVFLECLTETDVYSDCFYSGSSVTAKTAWTGSTSLKNMVAQIVGDGLVMQDVTISNTGTFTTDHAVKNVAVGLAYVSTLETMRFVVAINSENLRGSRMRKVVVYVGLLETKSLTIDGYPIRFRNFGPSILDQPLPSYSGTKYARVSGINADQTVVLTVTEPLPCIVLHVTVRLKTRGDLNA